MINMIKSVIKTFFQSYKSLVFQPIENWHLILKILIIPVSIFIYALTFLVISTVLLIVALITAPTAHIYTLIFKNN